VEALTATKGLVVGGPTLPGEESEAQLQRLWLA
jgi:hypothetical protein